MVDNITAYRKDAVAMGIIVYYVQKICRNNINAAETRPSMDNKVPAQNKAKKFCTKCGNSTYICYICRNLDIKD